MAVEPTQAEVTHHFMEMAKGKVGDEDMVALGKQVAGRGSSQIHYRMKYPSNATTPSLNVTSSVASVVDRAGSMVQKEPMTVSSVSRKRKRRSDNTKSSPTKKRRKKVKRPVEVAAPTSSKKKNKKKKKKST